MRKHLTPGTVLGTVAVVFACTGSATAGVLITSSSIKDGSIQARDIKKGTISSDRLASSVRTQLAKAGTPGPAGPAGAPGATTTVQGSAPTSGKDGVNGKDGAPGQAGKERIVRSLDAACPKCGARYQYDHDRSTFAPAEVSLSFET